MIKAKVVFFSLRKKLSFSLFVTFRVATAVSHSRRFFFVLLWLATFILIYFMHRIKAGPGMASTLYRRVKNLLIYSFFQPAQHHGLQINICTCGFTLDTAPSAACLVHHHVSMSSAKYQPASVSVPNTIYSITSSCVYSILHALTQSMIL